MTHSAQTAAEPDSSHKAAIFIGSSSEAKTILDRLVDVMSDNQFDPRPWTSCFSPGWTTLEVLQAQLREVEGSLLIFSKDDQRDFRGDRVEAARDNVVLEFGFFVSQFGARRVWILEEEGVGLPTDVLGLTTFKFKRDSEAQLEARVNKCVKEMSRVWPTLPPRSAPQCRDSRAEHRFIRHSQR